MSYMDRKNIIEGFFDLFKKLPKDVKRLKLNTFEKQLYNSRNRGFSAFWGRTKTISRQVKERKY